jgi:hypothetical protein
MKDENSYSEYVNEFFKQVIPTLEVLLARKLRIDEQKEIEDKLKQCRPVGEQFAKQLGAIKKSGNKAKLAEISNDFIRGMVPDAGAAESPLDYLLETLFAPKQIGVEYIRKSKYSEYLDVMKLMIESAMAKGLKQVTAYMSSVEVEVDDIQAWGQKVVSEMGRIIKYLAPDRQRYSKGLAFNCVAEYGKIAGVYERLVKILAGFVSIEANNYVDYNTFRVKSLGDNLKIIREKGWSILCQEFDGLIRNSIAHGTWRLEPNKRSVYFYDPISGREQLLQYRLLFEKTRSLSCLVLALSKFMGLVYEASLRKQLPPLH